MRPDHLSPASCCRQSAGPGQRLAAIAGRAAPAHAQPQDRRLPQLDRRHQVRAQCTHLQRVPGVRGRRADRPVRAGGAEGLRVAGADGAGDRPAQRARRPGQDAGRAAGHAAGTQQRRTCRPLCW